MKLKNKDWCNVRTITTFLFLAKAVERTAILCQEEKDNLNFTVNFNCDPSIPYFPASYHKSVLDNIGLVLGGESLGDRVTVSGGTVFKVS